MKKISTLYKKNPENLALVINEINPENVWALTDEALATRKYDGSAAAIIDGELYKRYDVKKGRQVPDGAIPCQEADEITGHHPHWVKCEINKPDDKYFFEALDNTFNTQPDYRRFNGTYELCGPKIQGNPEKLERHILIKHGSEALSPMRYNYNGISAFYSFDGFKQFLSQNDIEGIVFHHPDGRMCKIRKSDFGIKR